MAELNQRTKLVRNLVAWAGHDFSYMPDEHVELPAAIAEARIAAGLAAEPDNIDRFRGDVKKLEKALRENLDIAGRAIEDRNAAAEALASEQERHVALTSAHQALKAEHAELLASHDAAFTELASLKPSAPSAA